MPEKFDRWFQDTLKRMGGLIWAIGGGIIVAIFRPFIDSVWPKVWTWIAANPAHFEATIQFVQAGVVAVLYGRIFFHNPFIPSREVSQTSNSDKDHVSPSDAAESFYGWWHNWWPIVTIFYIVLGAKALYGQENEYIWNLGANLLINVSALFMLFCYFTLLGCESKRRLRKLRTLFLWVLVPISGLNALTAFIYHSTPWPQILFMIGSGLTNGVVFALLVGRFESKYLGTPHWVLVLLYIYSVMQATYGLYNSDLLKSPTLVHNFRTTISVIVLLLKVVFYGWISWMMREGRLTVYLENISSLGKEVQEKWSEVKSRNKNSAAATVGAS